ncbi:N-acetylmuramoyl-L-alanine amidase [Halorussus caseinilyticus]|uniref:N-acetylmuramoyl-L-alanine amidase n=1 Tax=Halorussus caseinilyticus TaxID=3034025 RepID=A0ABD5WTH6_9EURY
MRWIIIHVTEGSYEGTISWFKDPDANVSTHYVIENDSNAEITKMLNRGDIGWHAGNGGYNDTSLGFEHEGTPTRPPSPTRSTARRRKSSGTSPTSATSR